MVEAPAFYPYLSGRDNLVTLAKLARMSTTEIDAALARVGLSEAAQRPFSRYSMGMKQRLAIAAALLRKPALVLLDEPTTGLDPAGQREIRALIPQLARDGCTVFLSSHVMQEVQEICGRVGILRAGRLLRTAPVDQLLHGDSRAVFEIVTDNPALGQAILEATDWVAGVDQINSRLIVTTTVERAVDLNRTLAERGVYASEIRQRERSLEDVFFETLEEQVA
jgi:ABC-2 type transport system ATP-binding protein